MPELVTFDEAMHWGGIRRLTPSGRRWFRTYAKLLTGEGLLARTDLVWLELLAQASADREEAERGVREYGATVQFESGFVGLSAWAILARDAREREMKLLKDSPLTPAGRRRLMGVIEERLPAFDAILSDT